MKSVRRSFFSPRVILSILAGVAASMLFISLMRNYMLATVLGMLVAAIIAGLEQPKEFTLLGLVTGSIAGLYLGARNTLALREMPIGPETLGLAIQLLGGMILTGLLCAGYGLITGKLLSLYKKGQGPFF